jgi:hypothetical protein
MTGFTWHDPWSCHILARCAVMKWISLLWQNSSTVNFVRLLEVSAVSDNWLYFKHVILHSGWVQCLLLAHCLLGLLFDPENGSIIFLRNIGELLLDYVASRTHHRQSIITQVLEISLNLLLSWQVLTFTMLSQGYVLFLIFHEVGWDWVHSVHWPQFCILYQLWMIDDERGAVGGVNIGRGNQSTGRKPAPVPLFPPQIPHDLMDWTLGAAVGSWWLTAWAMAWLGLCTE